MIMDNNENKSLTEINDANITADTKSNTTNGKAHVAHAVNGVLRLILNIVSLFLFILSYSIITTIRSNNEIFSALFLSVFGFLFAIAGGIIFLIALILTIIALVKLVKMIQLKEKLSIATKIADVFIIILTIANGVFICLIIAALA